MTGLTAAPEQLTERPFCSALQVKHGNAVLLHIIIKGSICHIYDIDKPLRYVMEWEASGCNGKASESAVSKVEISGSFGDSG